MKTSGRWANCVVAIRRRPQKQKSFWLWSELEANRRGTHASRVDILTTFGPKCFTSFMKLCRLIWIDFEFKQTEINFKWFNFNLQDKLLLYILKRICWMFSFEFVLGCCFPGRGRGRRWRRWATRPPPPPPINNHFSPFLLLFTWPPLRPLFAVNLKNEAVTKKNW